MATPSNDKAPWQQADPPADDQQREEPVWTGLLPAVVPAETAHDHDDDGEHDGGRPGEHDERSGAGPRRAPGRTGGGSRAVGADEAAGDDDLDAEARRRAALRRDALADEPRLPRLQQVFLVLVLPLALLAAAVRVVATPLFLWAEYHRPGFPADSYGFSTEERMVFGSYGLDYVMNWAPSAFLGGLQDADGAQLFLSSEVAHMTDVKIVLQSALAAVAVLALLGIVSCLYLRAKAPGAASGALFFGSWLTVGLLVALAVAAVLGWQQFFALFHSLFFAEGSWTFRASDTLIRLYPTQFWMDAAIAVAGLALLGALAVMAATWPTAFRRHRALDRVRRRQELKQRLSGR
ncbi:TIGR01906 family membrane protein [Kocuria aegyptia]|uniref:TIGR01906 family membrane protein n=1 Tax=Kocuria aegyptia TaxID=330943 RepID=A0ABN2K1Q6_9MICC